VSFESLCQCTVEFEHVIQALFIVVNASEDLAFLRWVGFWVDYCRVLLFCTSGFSSDTDVHLKST